MSNVSEKLMRQLIVKPGRTVTELSVTLGMSRPALSNVLNGNAELSIDLAIKIEDIFGIDASKLLIQQLSDKLEEARAHVYSIDDE
jgi:antitoxin HigA-1